MKAKSKTKKAPKQHRTSLDDRLVEIEAKRRGKETPHTGQIGFLLKGHETGKGWLYTLVREWAVISQLRDGGEKKAVDPGLISLQESACKVMGAHASAAMLRWDVSFFEELVRVMRKVEREDREHQRYSEENPGLGLPEKQYIRVMILNEVRSGSPNWTRLSDELSKKLKREIDVKHLRDIRASMRLPKQK